MDAGVAHDHYAVGHRKRFLLIVRYVDHGRTETLLNALKLTTERKAGSDIERAHRLIEKNYRGVKRERTRNCNALLLTAREICRIFIRMLGESDLLYKLLCACCRAGAKLGAQTHGILDISTDVHILE